MKITLIASVALSIFWNGSASAHTYDITATFSFSNGGFPRTSATLVNFYYTESDGSVTTISVISPRVTDYLKKMHSKSVKIELERSNELTMTRIGDLTLRAGDVTGFWTGQMPNLNKAAP